ncbi:3D domain-containing protein, partial [Patescibacteria group bacterium]|nr:3D domain-containing protein [Patescibacteria group bacterium]
VCAVDRSEIPLGTLMYVNGYGLCRAEDIGGSIKGDRIDLGFEDVENGFWSARWTMIYLLME